MTRRCLSVLIVCEDITVVKEAERALRESEEFKNQILKSSADCIKVLDREGRIQYMNEAGLGPPGDPRSGDAHE